MSFIDAYITSAKKSLEGNIDFIGQEDVEETAKKILWTSAGFGFFSGFALQSLKVTFGIFGLGILLCAVVILPPWPAYNSHPVNWLPAQEAVVVEGKKDQ